MNSPSINEVLQSYLSSNKNKLKISENNTADMRYMQLLTEINNITNSLDTILKINNITKYYDIPNVVTELRYSDFGTSVIFLTMIGGGGAGGIGMIKGHFFYSGGGGGSGSYVLKLPIKINYRTILKLSVGKGGSIDLQPSSSIVFVYEDDNLIQTIECKPGNNANLNSGGVGGINYYMGNGNNGDDGHVTIPSAMMLEAGNGGASIFSQGGRGASSVYHIGGGRNGNIHGMYGSGGGGIQPSFTHKNTPGHGGNGFIVITT